MHHLTLTFRGLNHRLRGHAITAKGLHGMVFAALAAADPRETDWLHDHPTPKPYSLSPLYDGEGVLAGLRLGVMSGRAADLFARAWCWHRDERHPLRLGVQEFAVIGVVETPGPGWDRLAQARPARRLGLRFLSPTSFRQGPSDLPLPLPGNVFGWPWRVWGVNSTASLPDGWLDWCRESVFVVEHRIETVTVPIDKADHFTGFVGDVLFEARAGTEEQLRVFQALGQLAPYCGVGRKTTMGMGAVERLDGG